MGACSATRSPTFGASFASTESRIGMGQMSPEASFMLLQTDSKSFLPMMPVSGLNAPMPIISRSHDCFAERSIRLSDSASLFRLDALSAEAIRLMSVPPWGGIRPCISCSPQVWGQVM